MTIPNRPRYATRLNAFKRKGDTVAEMIERAGQVGGLNAADLNFPDHFDHHFPAELTNLLQKSNMALNGLAMRYYTDPGFRLGAFTHPDPTVRRAAIDITKRGLDALAQMGGTVMTVWLGQDGFDYSFQGDYDRMWDDTLAALAEICDHNPALDISIEYKPNEPRSWSVLPDMATTLHAIRDVARPNLGVTLDFCHMLFAGEVPAKSATLAARHCRIMGVHLNDGYGKRDDGLIAGTVHPVQTVELFWTLDRLGYDGVIYFDTFPDHGGMDPVQESRANLALTERLRTIATGLKDDPALTAAMAGQDAATTTRIIARALYGA
ncbi:sugar phosphate isomerase/epimerase [Rhodobacteraceae bacterium HSP-20]|uniref:Sugar phosphate isomerase/epimerase n=1 Tax=Paragemmobacter amnigenus TaxID=2852097 RepID=A0ABS6IYK1_9RHOB|nr:sugar phosphate isomerase/epimerase family protein [Rhodobacter amnigenus]MBU9696583.1 sugar phosphate isomerase/epimerase [Rhodobacter amnigenus]MBV4387810.1 sugar phosphate isomerase/epimerase [Rhodobacter amnigenus]